MLGMDALAKSEDMEYGLASKIKIIVMRIVLLTNEQNKIGFLGKICLFEEFIQVGSLLSRESWNFVVAIYQLHSILIFRLVSVQFFRFMST